MPQRHQSHSSHSSTRSRRSSSMPSQRQSRRRRFDEDDDRNENRSRSLRNPSWGRTSSYDDETRRSREGGFSGRQERSYRPDNESSGRGYIDYDDESRDQNRSRFETNESPRRASREDMSPQEGYDDDFDDDFDLDEEDDEDMSERRWAPSRSQRSASRRTRR